jgi:hypothetical protein
VRKNPHKIGPHTSGKKSYDFAIFAQYCKPPLNRAAFCIVKPTYRAIADTERVDGTGEPLTDQLALQQNDNTEASRKA